MDTYCQPATGQNSYTVSVQAVDFTDPNGGNNSYTETLDGGSGPPPGPTNTPAMPPGGSSWGVLNADLAVTDLYPDNHPQGGMMVRFTNRGPDSMSDVNVPVSCQVIAHFISAQTNPLTFSKDFTANVTLNKGQTSAHYTRIDLDTGLYWYEGRCTINPGWKDDNSANNSFGETIKGAGP
jgi:hypothetical protein